MRSSLICRMLRFALSVLIAGPCLGAQDAGRQAPSPGDSRIRVTSDLVLTNVVVRDRQGNLVRGLPQDAFSIYEDGKQQRISSFDFENVDQLATAGAAGPTVSGAAAPLKIIGSKELVGKEELKNHRLIVFFFDFSAMEPDDIDRAVSAAQKYVDRQMSAADLVAVISLASSMRVDQDFTNDKAQLAAVF